MNGTGHKIVSFDHRPIIRLIPVTESSVTLPPTTARELPLSELYAPSGFRDTLVAILRTSIKIKRDRMNAPLKTTEQSLIYRRRAADLARLAEAEPHEIKMLPLIHQALSWVQLAENEEALGEDFGNLR